MTPQHLHRVKAMLLLVGLAELVGCALSAIPAPIAPRTTGKNVLYFIVDDLRNEPGFTNHRTGIVTPNLDRLATSPGTTVFDRLYVQQGVCSPSRNSFLSGRRPDTTQVWNFLSSFRNTLGYDNVTSLPQAFKNAGFLSVGVGKVYHPGQPYKDDCPDRYHNCSSWSEEWPYFHGSESGCKGYHDKQSGYGPWEACGAPDSAFLDGTIMEKAVTRLRQLKRHQPQRFFLAVGFHKPHVPWNMPLRFLNAQVPEDHCDVAEHGVRDASQRDVDTAFHRCNHLGNNGTFSIDPDEAIPTAAAQQYRRAYRAAMTYMDYLVGRILAELETLGLADDTIIAFHSDHGWQLGERGTWCKQSNFELVARVPGFIHMPGTLGGRTGAVAELVDIYPTLLDLSEVSIPDRGALEGRSLASLIFLGNDHAANAPFTSDAAAAYTQYPRCNGTASRRATPDAGQVTPWELPTNNPCTSDASSLFMDMGYSIRTLRYRYTIWVRWHGASSCPLWDEVVGEELYDHAGDDGFDTDSFEYENLARDPKHSEEKAGLLERLRLQFRSKVCEGARQEARRQALSPASSDWVTLVA